MRRVRSGRVANGKQVREYTAASTPRESKTTQPKIADTNANTNMDDSKQHHHKPCDGCPYARATPPGQLRGVDVRRFIGQAIGPFLLPCHGYADRKGWSLDPSKPQCAGAAMYRDLVGVAHKMPPALSREKGDPELVFANAVEFLAHHENMTLDEAERDLRRLSPEAILLVEMFNQGVRKVPT